jgi:hypothetical protein
MPPSKQPFAKGPPLLPSSDGPALNTRLRSSTSTSHTCDPSANSFQPLQEMDPTDPPSPTLPPPSDIPCHQDSQDGLSFSSPTSSKGQASNHPSPNNGASSSILDHIHNEHSALLQHISNTNERNTDHIANLLQILIDKQNNGLHDHSANPHLAPPVPMQQNPHDSYLPPGITSTPPPQPSTFHAVHHHTPSLQDTIPSSFPIPSTPILRTTQNIPTSSSTIPTTNNPSTINTTTLKYPPIAPFSNANFSSQNSFDSKNKNNTYPTKSHPTSTSVFPTNEFVIAAKETIKYDNISSQLKDNILEDDSTFTMESFYNNIILSIQFGFKTHLETLPMFDNLDENISFYNIFHKGLLSFANASIVKRIYSQTGAIIKNYITKKGTIDPTNAPLAYQSIQIHKFDKDDWRILEHLLRDRLIRCGSSTTDDLSQQLTNLHFSPGETYTEFYFRCHQLHEEYCLRYNEPRFIPSIKILDTFVKHLARAPDYQPYLIPFQQHLIKHFKTYHDMDYSVMTPFDLKDVYDLLWECKVPSTPTSLHPLDPSPSSPSSHHKANDLSIIASFHHPSSSSIPSTTDDVTVLSDFCHNPVIVCSAAHTSRELCPACLCGWHDVNDCFARGPNFQPKGLRQ